MKYNQAKARKHDSGVLEQAYYESKPFLIAGVAIAGIGFQSGGFLRIPFALVLLFCSAVIIKWRSEARHGRV